jgi:K+-sensing histidine kinase KdpD
MAAREPTSANVSFFERLLAASQQMAHVRDLDRFFEHAARAVLELFDAERACFVMFDAQGRPVRRAQLDREGRTLSREEISRAILEHDSLLDGPTVVKIPADSPQTSSIVCAPLVSDGKQLGALYLENRSASGAFHPQDLRPLAIAAGQVAAALERALSTSALEQTVKQLERAWLDAVEANRIRTISLVSIAHDIRSPLGLSMTVLHTIREGTFGPLTELQISWLDRAMESLDHAISLTSDVFDLTKAELSGLKLNLELTNMQRFMMHLSQLGEGIDWAPSVTFEARIPSDLPQLTIDATRIQQVVFNLLSNAQRFTTSGQVLLYAQLREHDLLIGVRDSGAGVPPHQREAIFERFKQGEQDAEVRFRGTGLGLAISRELVIMHGGLIWVESELGQYSDFKFTLPLTSRLQLHPAQG